MFAVQSDVSQERNIIRGLVVVVLLLLEFSRHHHPGSWITDQPTS